MYIVFHVSYVEIPNFTVFASSFFLPLVCDEQLAVTWCEQQADIDGFDKDKALTKENLQSFMGMLSFGKFNGVYDTRINGLGLDMLVSEVQNTELKAPKVSKNIPTVAEVTQGIYY
jgi:hypothetical protein